jgi:alkyldihydroxyacetonephosphate synthase
MTDARLKHYGWGREGESMSAEERKFVLDRYRAKFATDEFETLVIPGLEDLSLREPRVLPPASLAAFCTNERYDRAAHAYGKSYPDYVRAMLGDYDCAPDVVAYPRNETEISTVMDWTSSVGASLTPLEAARAFAAASSRGLTASSTGLPSPSISAISPKSLKWIRYWEFGSLFGQYHSWC